VQNASHTEVRQAPRPPDEFVANQVALIDCEEIRACPVCGHPAFRPFAWGFDYELQTCGNCWRFVACEDCGHVWLNPRPALHALPTIYPPTYYAYNYKREINPVAVKGKEFLDRLKFRGIRRYLSRPTSSYLDIGCGDGRFLKLMEKQGVERQQIYGFELDEKVVQALRAASYQVFCNRVEDCDQIPENSLDLVTMFHVIEHVDDPARVVRKVFTWMAPGGVFAVETPNLDSLDARWFKETYWGGYHIPRHWNLFTPTTLARLLTDAGFEVAATRYQTGHSFWMYSLHHRLRYGRKPRPRLAQCFNPFQSLLPLIAFTAFDRLRAAFGSRTSAMLMLVRKPDSSANRGSGRVDRSIIKTT
jgi:2-polyprenyl-3-methyl-5-hydroxy-6-metoxy-1,4-benzoquinol methylase